nr:hypothetical protein [Mimivirus sp.]
MDMVVIMVDFMVVVVVVLVMMVGLVVVVVVPVLPLVLLLVLPVPLVYPLGLLVLLLLRVHPLLRVSLLVPLAHPVDLVEIIGDVDQFLVKIKNIKNMINTPRKKRKNKNMIFVIILSVNLATNLFVMMVSKKFVIVIIAKDSLKRFPKNFIKIFY